jgi:hypothetical protein
MNGTELTWRERTSDLEPIASIWTCEIFELLSRTTLADPCISIIYVKSPVGSEVFLRGPETKPRNELLIPGSTWTAIRLQPGVLLKNFSAEQFVDSFITIPADSSGRFQFEGAQLQFPSFNSAEQLVIQMQKLGYINGKALDSQELPRQGISSKSYSRLVKRTTGLSPYKLRQLQRIHEALHLLKQGMPATTVAAELGFVDQAHLNRATKQFLGHTPKELLQLPQEP